MSKRLVLSAVAACCFALLAAGSADDSDDSSSGGSSSSGIDDRVQTFSIGAPFKSEFEGIAYQVERVVRKDEIGSDSETKVAGPRSTFAVVYYVIENSSDKTRPVSADDFDLVDAEDRTYDTFSKGLAALQKESRRDLLLSEIEPDSTKMVATVYRVPEGALNDTFHLVVPGERFAADHNIRVEVQPHEVEEE